MSWLAFFGHGLLYANVPATEDLTDIIVNEVLYLDYF